MNLFTEISIIIVLVAMISLVMRLLRQPLIVGYILSGVIVGPYALNILQSHEEVELLSKIGVAILLFIVGLTLNPDVMREVGKASVVTGLGQVVFTSLVGFLIVSWLGFGLVPAIYIAIALTFSSTIIILKLLSDRGDTHKLYGKISVGFLLVQDILATLILLVITIVGASSTFSGSILSEVGFLLLKSVAALYVLYLASKYLLPGLSRFVAGSQEALFVFSIAWGLGISALFLRLGLSIEIGALAAGVVLAVSPFAHEIASRMKPLRDFFIMMFFVLLGSQLILSEASALVIPALILSAFVLIGNPIIVIILMNLMGFRTRTGFMAGLTVAQISEFSLILMALGYTSGHLSIEAVSLVTLVGIVTIAGSTYLILYADKIYPYVKGALRFITPRRTRLETSHEDAIGSEVVIFGYDRVGYDFVKVARELGARYVVVDFNPASIRRLIEAGEPHFYGDAEDVEFLQEIDTASAKLVISTIPEVKTNLLLIDYYRERNPDGILIVIAHSIEDAKEFYAAGASYVVMPHHLGAKHAANLIHTHQFNSEAFKEEKMRHLETISHTNNGQH